jgi:copper homeostasis protein
VLEVIACSLDDAAAAVAGGADRIELCSARRLGGLTPSVGLLTSVKRRHPQLPVMFMLRPRDSGFAYGERELSVMERDAELALEHRADGLVFGALTPAGAVDGAACRRLLRIAHQRPGCQTVFHRAFDVVADPREALKQIIDLGFTRVLTSGRARTALQGADEIRSTVDQAARRIEVLAGGGIKPETVAELVRKTGVNQAHASLTRLVVDTSISTSPTVRFDGSGAQDEREYRATDEAAVRAVRRILDQLS